MSAKRECRVWHRSLLSRKHGHKRVQGAFHIQCFIGAPERTRTFGPQLRRLLLYPPELQALINFRFRIADFGMKFFTHPAPALNPQSAFCNPQLNWSGREDSNLRLSAPKADALPGCATPRGIHIVYPLIGRPYNTHTPLYCQALCGRHICLFSIKTAFDTPCTRARVNAGRRRNKVDKSRITADFPLISSSPNR
jgi:hypothetical protein